MISLPENVPGLVWDRKRLARFKRAYKKAKSKNMSDYHNLFLFDGYEFYVPYAGYLIEHLEGMFGKKTQH